MEQPLAFQPGKPSLRIVHLSPHGFQAGYGTPPVEDEDRFAVLHLINQGAQVVLGIVRVAVFIWLE
jgi:hypothetical protein